MKILLSLIFLLGFSFSTSADTTVQILLANQQLGPNQTVYCFHASGAYAGLTAKTNIESVAAFNLETGEYKFRHTYEGVQFWSGIISAGGNAQINIPAPTQIFLSISNMPGGENQIIYPFTATGVYLGYTKKTNAMSQALFNLPPGSYKFRYTYDGVQFWSNPVMAGMQTVVQVPAPTQVFLSVSNQPGGENQIIYPFTANGVYLGYTKKTNAMSQASFNLPPGSYKFRYTYDGVQFWSNPVMAGMQTAVQVPAPTPVFLSINNMPGGENQVIYPFSADGTYLGYIKRTNAMSVASFNLFPGDYKFRYTHDGVQFWSDPSAAGMPTAIRVPAPATEVTVLLGDIPLGADLTVYPFTADGTYLGYTKKTNAQSTAFFDLPEGNYKFRYTHEGVQFWSEEISASEQTVIQVPTSTLVTVKLGNELLGEGLTVYPFTADGTYLGYTQKTDADSIASFNLPEGNYKFRYTHDGVQFWSEEIIAPAETVLTVPASTLVTLLLENELLGEGLTIYPFTADGNYLGYTKKTNAESIASFNLPDGNYKFRYTHDGVQFWSEEASAPAETVLTVPAPTLITLLLENEPMGEGLTVYPFTADGTYLGYTKKTDADSIASFNLPDGNYKFRYTHDGVQFWSEETSVPAETVLTVPAPILVTLLLENEPLGEGLTIYPFTADGTYLGYTKKTDADSIASFNLPDGNYKFRYTHDGVQFWSEEISASEQTIIQVPTPTQVTVKLGNELLGEGLTVYPFTADGTYLGYTKKTNTDSIASFNLPGGNYKFRYTYDGVQFWSEEIIDPAEAVLTVPAPTQVALLFENEPMGENLTIYPFTADGTYLGYTKKTNADSIVSFNLPEGNYKFRYTYDNMQFWSEETTALAETTINIPPPTIITVLKLENPINQIFMLYPFREDGVYSGYGKNIDANSIFFRHLPGGVYDFRMNVEGVEHWLYEVEAGEERTFSTYHTAVTLSKLDEKAGVNLKCILLNQDGQNTNKSFFTDSESTILVLPPTPLFRMNCALEDGIFTSTAEISSGGYEELNFFGHIRYKTAYSGIIPSDYDEQLCFLNKTRATEICDPVHVQGEMTFLSGSYDVVYKLEDREQIIDSFYLPLTNTVFDFEFDLPVVRQLFLSNNEVPLSGKDLILQKDNLEITFVTNDNGHIFFTEIGEWEVCFEEGCIGFIPDGQEFTHISTSTAGFIQSTEAFSPHILRDPEESGFIDDEVIIGTKFFVNAINPQTGRIEGGEVLVISGKGFTEGTTVFIGGKEATIVHLYPDGLEILSPSFYDNDVFLMSEPVWVDLMVNNSEGQTIIKSDFFQYIPPDWSTPPKVKMVFPGSIGEEFAGFVPRNSKIAIIFDMPVQPETVTQIVTGFLLEDKYISYKALEVLSNGELSEKSNLIWDETKKIYVFDSGSYYPDLQRIEIGISDKILNASGVGLVTTDVIQNESSFFEKEDFIEDWFFITDTTIDESPLTIISPADISESVGLHPALTIVFNKPVNPLTMKTDDFVLIQLNDEQVIPIKLDLNPDGLSISIQPTVLLQPNFYYKLLIKDQNLESLTGNKLNTNWIHNFYTTQFELCLLSLYPDNGQTEVVINSLIIAEFDQFVAEDMINVDSFSVTEINTDEKLNGSFSSSSNGMFYTFTPAECLEAGKTYEIKISANIKSQLGVSLAAEQISSFRVSIDNMEALSAPPIITSIYPTHGSTMVSPDIGIMITFNELLHPADINSDYFRLFESDSGYSIQIPVSISQGSSLTTVLLFPQSPLLAGYYRIYIDGNLRNQRGNILGNDTDSFFTVSEQSDQTSLIECFMPDLSGFLLNPTQHTYGYGINTEFNMSVLSIPVYITQTAEISFTLYRESENQYIEQEPQIISKSLFTAYTGDNEFIWHGVNDNGKFLEPGHYFFQIESENQKNLRFLTYDNDLQLKIKNVIDFIIAY